MNPAFLLVAALAMANVGSASAQPTVISSSASARLVPLAPGQSIAVDLPADIADVLVGDPKIVRFVTPTKRRAYITGAEVGQSSVFFFDEARRQIGALDVRVSDAPVLDPPVLENATTGGHVINFYRGTEHVGLLCNQSRCTSPPPKPTAPTTNLVITGTTTMSGPGGGTSTYQSTATMTGP